MITGTIFDIQRFSLHDGPGIRTTVFLKGCSLHCFWCHNPEGLVIKPQVQFVEGRCIQCGTCVEVCPEGAQELHEGVRYYNRKLCKECGKCIDTCYVEALIRVGKIASVDEVMREIVADKPFYETSGGGVTLSGGEPALQPAFASAVLEACRQEGIHTAIETAGNVPWSNLEPLIRLSDLVMMDLKHMDETKHRQATGVSNRRILENAAYLAQSNKPILFRTPLIPTVNDDDETIKALSDFILALVETAHRNSPGHPGISWEFLTFHKLATDKYRGLGFEYKASELEFVPKERFLNLIQSAQTSGIPIKYSI